MNLKDKEYDKERDRRERRKEKQQKGTITVQIQTSLHSLSQLTTVFVCIKQLDSNKSHDKTYTMQLKGGYQNTAID